MPNKRDRIFVSIGVSKPGGGLDQLPGAITASERMAAWAESQNYVTLLLNDKILPEITVDVLRDAIAAAITEVTDRTELKRLVIFFAGHGAALAIGDQYWILTNWQKRTTEAIKVSSLQRMLEYYGPRQVAVIGDACQEFSSKFIDLIGSAVLDKPDEDQRPYELDQFFAVDVGKQAFMIKAKGDKKDFCLFTEVLLDALEGDAHESYFEMIGTDKVITSQSLARHIDTNLSTEAGKHGVRMIPRPKPGFYTDRVYLAIPVVPPSTSSSRKARQKIAIDEVTDADLSDEEETQTSYAEETGGEVSFDLDVLAEADEDEAPPLPPAGRIRKTRSRFRSTDKPKLVRSRKAKAGLALEIETLARTREANRKAFFDEVGSHTVRDHFETGCGICVSGADVDRIEASFGVVSDVYGQPNWYRIELQSGHDRLGWSDALVTLADGRIVSVCAISGFVAALHILDENSLSLFHRPIGASEYEGHEAIDLLAKAHAGVLSREQIVDTALMLREGKHRIITLGCIVAQFYDTIRDVDSLRSIAAFYAMNGQPVPLDIILYGGGTISDHEGRLYADIPAVAAREPRTAEERRQTFTYGKTPEFKKHPIAGRIPWMRQAWGAIATASYDASGLEWRRQALAAIDHLAPGIFTVAWPQGWEAFAELAGIMVEHEKEPDLAGATH